MAKDNRENTSSQLGTRQGQRAVQETMSQLKQRSDYSEKELKKLSKIEEDLNKKVVKSKYKMMQEAEEAAHQKRLKDAEEEGNKIKAAWEKNFGTAQATMSTLTSVIDKSLKSYLDAQQTLSAHLVGASSDAYSIMNRLQGTLSTSNIVKQENVFNNLTNFVKSGITYNVEQRAFLQTLAQDIDMVFNAQDGSLTQLIRLQNRDLSANRMAIEYSLQEFLNQNYQTSEYIRSGFLNVSKSLLESQATMAADQAMRYEAVVQGQLGQFFSAGFNEQTVTGIANALNELGSGKIPTGGGLSNLVLMAAARAGLDYGSLLNQGLNEQSANTILSSLAGYLQEMGANQSNVVRAQLGNLFGVSLTDIIASQNLKPITGAISTDISKLLGDYGGFVNFGKQFENIVDNMMYGFGTNMASNRGMLFGYEVSKLLANSGLGNILWQAGEAINDIEYVGGLAGSILQIAGSGINNAPLLPILINALTFIPELTSSLSSYTQEGSAALNIFNALGNAARGSTVKVSQAGVSGSMYIGSGNTTDLLQGSTSSLNDFTSNLGISTTMVESDKPTIDENVETITTTVISMLDLLETRLKSLDENVLTLAATNNVYSAGWTAINNFVM